MQTITIKTGSADSTIVIGERLSNLQSYLPPGKTIVITDHQINRMYNDRFFSLPVISIGQGEKHKTLQTIEAILDKLVEFEADRSTYIVAIGGGIV